MRNISDMAVNLDVDYARRHRYQLAHFFNHYRTVVEKNLQMPLLAYCVRPEQFDDLGTLWFDIASLDTRSTKLIQTIEDSYMATSFFTTKSTQLGSRGYVYYNSAMTDDDSMRSFLRFLNYATISVQLLADLYPKYTDRWEFGLYALLDDIRYKLIILDNSYPELFDSSGACLTQVVNVFYDYLQGTMPAPSAIHALCEQLQAALFVLLRKSEPPVLRTYKEADHPLQNLMFRETLAEQLKGVHIDTIIGIRFGGAELPHLMQRCFSRATLSKVRVSKYSGGAMKLGIDPRLCKDKTVLVMDDNALTGRTLTCVINLLNTQNVAAVYFGCVTYAGFKRFHQMLMEDHGVLNPEVLLHSCTVAESQYTKITNSRSYKNSNGVFDKVKARLQRRMSDGHMGYKL